MIINKIKIKMLKIIPSLFSKILYKHSNSPCCFHSTPFMYINLDYLIFISLKNDTLFHYYLYFLTITIN